MLTSLHRSPRREHVCIEHHFSLTPIPAMSAAALWSTVVFAPRTHSSPPGHQREREIFAMETSWQLLYTRAGHFCKYLFMKDLRHATARHGASPCLGMSSGQRRDCKSQGRGQGSSHSGGRSWLELSLLLALHSGNTQDEFGRHLRRHH